METMNKRYKETIDNSFIAKINKLWDENTDDMVYIGCMRAVMAKWTRQWTSSNRSQYRPYAYDIIISLRPHLGDIELPVNAVVSNVPAADHKRVQGNGFCPQHGGAVTSMHRVY